MGHHPGLVDAFARVARITLPQPSYVTIAKPVRPIRRKVPVSYLEGDRKGVTLTPAERNPRARRDCLDHYGTECVVCLVQLGDRYGPVATGLIHVHHIIPLGESVGVRATEAVRDLRPVCPNCHAVIHRRNPPLSVEHVRRLFEKHSRLSD